MPNASHQKEKDHCGHNDNSCFDHNIAEVSSDLLIFPEQCRSLLKRKLISLADQFLGVEFNRTDPGRHGYTNDTKRKPCDGRGWLHHETFLTHMQQTTLKV